MALWSRWPFKSIIYKPITYNSMTIRPCKSVGNGWLCQAPYGDPAGPTLPPKQVKDGAESRGMQRCVLIVSCQIHAARVSSTAGASSGRSRLQWRREEVRERRRAIGWIVCLCCAAENWCWGGLTGSVSVHWETVIQSDRVVFPSLCKGYAIASNPHDTLNEPLLPELKTFVRSAFKSTFKSTPWSWSPKSALDLNISTLCL